MTEEIHLNDVGTRILLRFEECGGGLDFTQITSLVTLVHCFKPPIGDAKELIATFAITPSLCGSIFAGDGSDGWTESTIISSAFWDEEGTWRIQSRMTGPGFDFRSERKSFTVFGNICP